MRQTLVHTFLLFLFFICAGAVRMEAQTPDPGLAGTHSVLKAEYNLGDLAYTPPSSIFPYSLEVRGSVIYPADLSSGPFPVIFILHGRHETCYDSVTLATSSAWPCTGTKKPILSYEGHDYASRTLASHGYIVISVSANAINAKDGSVASSYEDGMPARGYLLQHHMDLWQAWDTTNTGPFDTTFIGKLDMHNIGTMGHSRGGEGVIFNAELNRSLGSPYGINAILTLAPTDFYRHHINGIPLLDVAPYCDGDVNDLEGVHYYDDARYSDSTDEAPKHTILMMGANHDYFNTVWTPGSYVAGGADDWLYSFSNSDAQCGESASTRFDTTKQKAAYNAYSAAFFRTYIGHETTYEPILEVSNIVPPASSMLDTTNVFVSYHPGRTLRQDVNRADTASALATNTIGGAVSDSGLVTFSICGGGLSETACGVSTHSAQEPHKGTTTQRGLSQMGMRWNDTTEWVRNTLPAAYEDLSSFESILFRATVNYKYYTAPANLDFSVQLIDSAGNTSSQPVSNFSRALFHEPGTQITDLPKDIYNTIRIPVAAFSGIDITKVQAIKFKFNKAASGAILISDLALLSQPCGKFGAAFTDSVNSPGYTVTYTNTSSTNARDTISWLWNFGDPASGTADTSSSLNGSHLYPGPGTYTACLYGVAHRPNGTLCTDTVCTAVTVSSSSGIANFTALPITIVPNPAKDHLHIAGADNTDVLTLTNLYGQMVFTATISQPDIALPPSLPPGVYYAVVTTKKGRVFEKLLIAK